MPKFVALGMQPCIELLILRESSGAEARCPDRDRLDKIGDRGMLRERKESPHPIPETDEVAFVRNFGPLSTGARILPVAISIAIASVVGAILAPRVGTRAVVVTGLTFFGAAMAWIALSVGADTSYWATIVCRALSPR